MLQKIAYFSAFLVLLACGPSALPIPHQAEALQTQVGIDALMGSTCATGYSRVAPHVCQQQCTECQGLTQFTADNACHAIDLHAAYNYPNTIAQGLGHLKIYNLAINSANVAFYTLSNCTGTAYLTANGIAGFQPVYMFPVQVMSGNIYYKTVNGAGGNYGVIQPVDYYD